MQQPKKIILKEVIKIYNDYDGWKKGGNVWQLVVK